MNIEKDMIVCIKDFKRKYDGLSPSYRDMAKQLDLSIGKVQRTVLGLIERGDVKRGPRGGLMVKPFNGWKHDGD